MTPPALDAQAVARSIEAALAEDLGARGDITSLAVVSSELRARAHVVAREPLVVAGIPIARGVFLRLDAGARFPYAAEDGRRTTAGERVLTVEGRAIALLEGERTALNFLQRLSGIATATAAAVQEIAGTGARILDTRKTAPGLRLLDKYAVAVGGGTNNRIGLYDQAMIKDTHLGAAASLGDAVRACLSSGVPADAITAEVRNRRELEEAIAAGAGRAILDNMSLDDLAACVALGKGKIVLEASGGLRPGRLKAVAATGVDALSLGYLTHSVAAADLAMDLESLP
ncbi:MAG TPA: carboxylating nicotinate-nucleotide diphosphorylase [Candidatus Polarisedimenticolaceae bacterium]|nr:carboxylating nicotinate-nucleotide diphosphorylase [Candidatus Polarisedimenticolaceae bacterium]